ncbi:MAG: hypothetical protein LBO00_03370 [Zoogloeaceae bacterium]|nr:hypothetical protein [Zoogloeaceae bacterium]
MNPGTTAHLKIPFLLGIIILLVLFLYCQTIGFGYVWDDQTILAACVSVLLENGVTAHGLGRHFLSDLPYFRPLVILSYCLDAYLSGWNSKFFHATNLVFFVANVIILFWLALRVARILQRENPEGIAFFSALIYALHPALTEPVVWISGRFDLFVTTFILCVTHAFLGNGRAFRRIFAFAFFSLCALFSKEIALLIPLSLFFLHAAILGHGNGTNVKAILGNFLLENRKFWIAFAVALFIYFVYRYYSENSILDTRSSIGTPLVALKLYFQDAFVPFYSISPRHPLDVNFAMADALACLAAVSFLFWILFQSFHKRSAAASVFIAGFIYLIPVLLRIPGSTGDVISDRYLAAPLAFWSIAVCMIRYDRIFGRFLRGKLTVNLRIFWILPAGWLLMALISTAIIVPSWENDTKLWGWTYAQHPNDSSARDNYFAALLGEGKIDRLETEIRKVLERPDAEISLPVWIIHGSVLVMKKDPESLVYLENLVDWIPMFRLHLLGDSADVARSQISTMEAMYATTVFLNYSVATFVLAKDIRRAMSRNEIARWYSVRTGVTQSMIRTGKGMPQLEYNNILYLYASGEFETAEAALDLLTPQAKAAAQSYARAHLQDFCREALPEHVATCDALRERGIF